MLLTIVSTVVFLILADGRSDMENQRTISAPVGRDTQMRHSPIMVGFESCNRGSYPYPGMNVSVSSGLGTDFSKPKLWDHPSKILRSTSSSHQTFSGLFGQCVRVSACTLSANGQAQQIKEHQNCSLTVSPLLREQSFGIGKSSVQFWLANHSRAEAVWRGRVRPSTWPPVQIPSRRVSE